MYLHCFWSVLHRLLSTFELKNKDKEIEKRKTAIRDLLSQALLHLKDQTQCTCISKLYEAKIDEHFINYFLALVSTRTLVNPNNTCLSEWRENRLYVVDKLWCKLKTLEQSSVDFWKRAHMKNVQSQVLIYLKPVILPKQSIYTFTCVSLKHANNLNK